MPLHDWTRVDAGLFPDFHQRWIAALCNALNAGVLPSDCFALVEQRIQGPIPDVLPLKLATSGNEPRSNSPGLAVADTPPHARLIRALQRIGHFLTQCVADYSKGVAGGLGESFPRSR
jgi:hypothetical protein